MSRFKHPAMQKIYEVCRIANTNRCEPLYINGAIPSIRITGISGAYWLGRDGRPSRYVRDSLAYAAWAAGRDDRKAESRSRTWTTTC